MDQVSATHPTPPPHHTTTRCTTPLHATHTTRNESTSTQLNTSNPFQHPTCSQLNWWQKHVGFTIVIPFLLGLVTVLLIKVPTSLSHSITSPLNCHRPPHQGTNYPLPFDYKPTQPKQNRIKRFEPIPSPQAQCKISKGPPTHHGGDFKPFLAHSPSRIL